MNLTGRRTPFLHWLPDESFYSICSRQHIFLGNQAPGETLNFLFGARAKSFSHDLPNNLSFLNEGAKSAWGDSEEIICKHSIAPLFFPFQSLERIEDFKEAMRSPSLGSLKYRLGLVTGKFGGEHPLKACLKCMKADRSTFGTTYWHLSHQIPGVTVCPIHGSLLMESTENRQWSRRYQWLLPDEGSLLTSGQPSIDPATLIALQTVSDSAVALCKMGTTAHFDPVTVAQVYKEACSKLGTSRKARESAADCFAQCCTELQPYPPFTALGCSRRWALGFISQMARKPRGYCHPLKHLTIIWWLFGKLESFVDAYQQYSNDLQALNNRCDSQLMLAPSFDDSPSIVKKQSGAPKPKKLFNDLKEEVLNAMVSGLSKNEVCSRFNLSISTVNRLLRSNPAHNQHIINNSFRILCETQRSAWLSITNQHPNASANIIKKLIPNVYAWLYRNDRSWLMLQTKNRPSGRGGNHVAVDWEARDEKLYSLVKKALENFTTDSQIIRKRDLYQIVPNLFSSLQQKSHYPKTRLLVFQAFS